MASAKRQREAEIPEELPAAKRHANGEGPLKGLQKVNQQTPLSLLLSFQIAKTLRMCYVTPALSGYTHGTTMQIPRFGAFYPPPQASSSQKQEKRQLWSDSTRRAVRPKLLRRSHDTAASWDAPELVDDDKGISSTGVSSGVPALLTLPQQPPKPSESQQIPAQQNLAGTEFSNPVGAVGTAAPAAGISSAQSPASLWQPSNAIGQSESKGAEAQAPAHNGKQAVADAGAHQLNTAAASGAGVKDSAQPQAAPRQVSFGPPQILGFTAAPDSTQQSAVPPVGMPGGLNIPSPGGGAPLPAQNVYAPLHPGTAATNPFQQPALAFGQPIPQV
jgi:hypothetical protein